MIRTLSDFDFDRMGSVTRWPLRDALLCYLGRLKERARRDYEVELICWAVRSPHMKKGGDKPPKPPEILKE